MTPSKNSIKDQAEIVANYQPNRFVEARFQAIPAWGSILSSRGNDSVDFSLKERDLITMFHVLW
jgi:hypothetical protein